jgi:uncharacterized protein (DUF952 family)
MVTMVTICHIPIPQDWRRVQAEDACTVSTKGRSLGEQGFIHAGTAAQVAPVANMVYRVRAGLSSS